MTEQLVYGFLILVNVASREKVAGVETVDIQCTVTKYTPCRAFTSSLQTLPVLAVSHTLALIAVN